MMSHGANPRIVQANMGHSDLRTTMRYTHAVSDEHRVAIEHTTEVFLRSSDNQQSTKSIQ